MRLTNLFTKTRKDAPADEVAKNARLLIRAGFIHKEMAGVYSYLPLGLRVLKNIEEIVREEMDAIGGQEVQMPALQLKERYEATGRWDDAVVDNWFKTKLANGVEVGLGFSHEENLTPIVKEYVLSRRDVPFAAYQIQTKFRNELRSKSGLMRGREFLMKDMYSFAMTDKQHREFYERAAEAYGRVYARLGIGEKTVRVLASGGSFSKYSDEFQTFSEAGEDTIFQTTDGTYYNREVAPSKIAVANAQEDQKILEEVKGDGIIGVQALLKHLNITIEHSTKTLIFTTDTGEHVIAALRSDYEINDIKLCEVLGCESVRMTAEADVRALTGADIGYAGLINLPSGVRLVLDDSLQGLCNFETGSNKTGFHAVNVNFGRDVPLPEQFYDIKVAREGDLDPKTGQPMRTEKSIEVGNIFTLGTKFSKPFGLVVTDENDQEITVIMGCYGIGVSRVMGTIAELQSDERGLVWSPNIAPYKVYLASVGESSEVAAAADKLYAELQDAGITVLYDDRDARAGEKFADADLMGIPLRVVISEKTIAKQKYECKRRDQNDIQMLDIGGILGSLASPGTGKSNDQSTTHPDEQVTNANRSSERNQS